MLHPNSIGGALNSPELWSLSIPTHPDSTGTGAGREKTRPALPKNLDPQKNNGRVVVVFNGQKRWTFFRLGNWFSLGIFVEGLIVDQKISFIRDTQRHLKSYI